MLSLPIELSRQRLPLRILSALVSNLRAEGRLDLCPALVDLLAGPEPMPGTLGHVAAWHRAHAEVIAIGAAGIPGIDASEALRALSVRSAPRWRPPADLENVRELLATSRLLYRFTMATKGKEAASALVAPGAALRRAVSEAGRAPAGSTERAEAIGRAREAGRQVAAVVGEGTVAEVLRWAAEQG